MKYFPLYPAELACGICYQIGRKIPDMQTNNIVSPWKACCLVQHTNPELQYYFSAYANETWLFVSTNSWYVYVRWKSRIPGKKAADLPFLVLHSGLSVTSGARRRLFLSIEQLNTAQTGRFWNMTWDWQKEARLGNCSKDQGTNTQADFKGGAKEETFPKDP